MKRPVVITLLSVALALVCIGIGSVAFFAVNNGFPDRNPFEPPQISVQAEESKTIKVDLKKPLSLDVVDHAGDVTIIGSDVETVQIKATRTAYASSQEKANAELATVKYSIEEAGNKIIVKYEYLENTIVYDHLNTVDFVITVPNEIAVDVDSGSGLISVSNIKGAVTVDNDFGEVELENIEGALTANNNSGEVSAESITANAQNIELSSDFGSVTLKQANGKDITVNSNSGKIILKDVRATGDITTWSDFGSTNFENGSAKSLSVETNSGTVELLKLKVGGQIKVDNDFGNIELTQAIAESYDLHTNSGTVTVDGAKGLLKASTDFGNINIENAEKVTLDISTNSGTVEFSGSLGEGPHLVRSDFGQIDLTLAADSALTVDLKTEFGKITSDLPVTITLSGASSSEGDEVNGVINGGGAILTVTTNSGNIIIHAGK